MDESLPIAGAVSLADKKASAMDEQKFQLLYEATARPILAYLVGTSGRREPIRMWAIVHAREFC